MSRNNPGARALKWVFALEYVLQGLVNPFLGITAQPFYRHLRFGYGLSEGEVQQLVSRSYLAWSFKPIIGFLVDAYGKTRTLLIGTLGFAALGFLLTPVVDVGPMAFFWAMFVLSVVLAATDVAVDRATVIAGDEESHATGRSRATTVGLNQAICWLAVYGSSTVAALSGGFVADHVPFKPLVMLCALAPVMVLLAVLRLPKDTAIAIPLRRSIGQFWAGLNSGAVLGVMLFFFLFHFQPQVGPIFINYMMETLHLSQTQIGIGDGATNVGYFASVLLFMWKGVGWQERLGLRRLFRIYIVVAAVVGLTQYTLLEPRFSAIAGALARGLPFLGADAARVGFLCLNNFILAAALGLFRMSTISLVGAVVPVAAAGSLFAGFMSVANLGYSFSYSTGAWLYDHGMALAPLRAAQQAVFGIAGGPSDKLSMNMLILIGSVAYFASFIAVHVLPGREATMASEGSRAAGPERWLVLPAGLRRFVDGGALAVGAALVVWLVLRTHIAPVASVLMTFLGVCLARKWLLDTLLKRQPTRAPHAKA